MTKYLALTFPSMGADDPDLLLWLPGGKLMATLPDVPHRTPAGFQDMATAPEDTVI